jgi:tetratricopeptide (TPR) repeat protein
MNVARLLVPVLLAAPALAAGSELEEALGAFRAGEYKRALEIAAAVAPGSEDRPRAAYLAGETQLVLGDVVAAEASFREVVEERPRAVPALVGLGRALTQAGAVEEAAAPLLEALELEPGDLAARRAMGELHTAAGRLPKARELLIEVFERDPKDPMSARALVDVLLRMQVGPDAMRVAEDFTIARATHPMGYFLMGIVQEQMEDDEAAIRSYQLAIERDPRFVDAHKNLGILCHTLSSTYQIVERNKLAMEHYAAYFALGGKDDTLQRTYEQMKTFLGPDGNLLPQPANG